MGWIGDTLWAVDFGRLHLFDARLTFTRTIAPASIAVRDGVQRILHTARRAEAAPGTGRSAVDRHPRHPEWP